MKKTEKFYKELREIAINLKNASSLSIIKKEEEIKRFLCNQTILKRTPKLKTEDILAIIFMEAIHLNLIKSWDNLYKIVNSVSIKLSVPCDMVILSVKNSKRLK